MIFALFICLSCQNTNAQSIVKKETDVQSDGLIGKVKQVTGSSYNATDKFGEIVQGTRTSNDNYLVKYNDKGFQVENIQYWYNRNGDFTKYASEFKYKNILNKNVIEILDVYNGDALDSKTIAKYDDNGNQIEVNRYKADGTLNVKVKCQFDDRGNKIEENTYNSDGSLSKKVISKYDTKNNIIEEDSEDHSGDQSVTTVTFKYDIKGNIIEKRIQFKNFANMRDGNIHRASTVSLYTYKYNDKNKEIESNSYQSQDVNDNFTSAAPNKRISKYDISGKLVETKAYNPDGSLTTTILYKYDEKGNKTEENYLNADGKNRKITTQYVYDSMGNWIKKIEIDQDVPNYIKIREIEYY